MIEEKKNKKPSVKDYEGSVDVAGDVTPVTRQPIPKVESNKWNEMSVNDLYEQRSILYGRMVIASQVGSEALMTQLQFGINQLEALIQHKSEQEEQSEFS